MESDCAKIREALPLVAGGEAGEAERNEALGHAEACGPCRRALEELRAIRGAALGVPALDAPPPRIAGLPRSARPRRLAWAAAAAALAAGVWIAARPRPAPAPVVRREVPRGKERPVPRNAPLVVATLEGRVLMPREKKEQRPAQEPSSGMTKRPAPPPPGRGSRPNPSDHRETDDREAVDPESHPSYTLLRNAGVEPTEANALEVLRQKAAPPVAIPEPELAALAEKLGHDDFSAREEASERLRQAGATALPVLRAAAASGDPEVRARAEQLVRDIEIPGRRDLKEAAVDVLLRGNFTAEAAVALADFWPSLRQGDDDRRNRIVIFLRDALSNPSSAPGWTQAGDEARLRVLDRLVSILESQDVAREIRGIASDALRSAAGRDLGRDPTAWRRWLADGGRPLPPEAPRRKRKRKNAKGPAGDDAPGPGVPVDIDALHGPAVPDAPVGGEHPAVARATAVRDRHDREITGIEGVTGSGIGFGGGPGSRTIGIQIYVRDDAAATRVRTALANPLDGTSWDVVVTGEIRAR